MNKKTYMLPGDERIVAGNAKEFVHELRVGSWMDSDCTDEQYMHNFAERYVVQSGACGLASSAFASTIQSNRRAIFFLMSRITALVALIQRLNSPFSVRMPFFSIARTVAPSWIVGSKSTPCRS